MELTEVRLTTAHHAHGKNGVVGDFRVSIMRELAEGVQNVETRVGHRNKGQGKGHCSPQCGLTITQLVKSKRSTKQLECNRSDTYCNAHKNTVTLVSKQVEAGGLLFCEYET